MVVFDGWLRTSRGRGSNLYFPDTVLHLRVRNFCMHPSRTCVALVAYASTSDVADLRRGILGSRVCVGIYVARHLEE